MGRPRTAGRVHCLASNVPALQAIAEDLWKKVMVDDCHLDPSSSPRTPHLCPPLKVDQLLHEGWREVFNGEERGVVGGNFLRLQKAASDIPQVTDTMAKLKKMIDESGILGLADLECHSPQLHSIRDAGKKTNEDGRYRAKPPAGTPGLPAEEKSGQLKERREGDRDRDKRRKRKHQNRKPQTTSMTAAPSSSTVLVSGGSGFIAQHCIVQLLDEGYGRVRTTIRGLAKEESIRALLAEHVKNADVVANVEFFEADLLKDEGWEKAISGCQYVLHVASPFPAQGPKHEDEVIKPAVEGSLRVLRAAKAVGGVERIVLTSSCASIAYGHSPKGAVGEPEPYGPDDWTEVDNKRIGAYTKSKTLAERAAWKFMEENETSFDLATICPSLVCGPVLSPSFGTSADLILKILKGQLPVLPPLGFGVVDVRDVASAHVAAIREPAAGGKRFITSTKFVFMKEIAQMLKSLPEVDAAVPASAISKVSTRVAPTFLIKFLSWFASDIADMRNDFNRVLEFDTSLTRELLQWKPFTVEDSIKDLAKSLIKYKAI